MVYVYVGLVSRLAFSVEALTLKETRAFNSRAGSPFDLSCVKSVGIGLHDMVSAYQITVRAPFGSTAKALYCQEIRKGTRGGRRWAVIEGVDDVDFEATQSNDLGEYDSCFWILSAVGGKVV